MAGGRPTKLTPELEAKIVALIRAGNYIETAAAACGVSRSTLHDWLREGARAKSGRLREFSDTVEKAQSEAEARDVTRIDQAINDNWQAAAWRLERKFPHRWGRKERLEHSGPNGGPITYQKDLSNLSPEELMNLAQLVRKARGPATA